MKKAGWPDKFYVQKRNIPNDAHLQFATVGGSTVTPSLVTRPKPSFATASTRPAVTRPVVRPRPPHITRPVVRGRRRV